MNTNQPTFTKRKLDDCDFASNGQESQSSEKRTWISRNPTLRQPDTMLVGFSFFFFLFQHLGDTLPHGRLPDRGGERRRGGRTLYTTKSICVRSALTCSEKTEQDVRQGRQRGAQVRTWGSIRATGDKPETDSRCCGQGHSTAVAGGKGIGSGGGADNAGCEAARTKTKKYTRRATKHLQSRPQRLHSCPWKSIEVKCLSSNQLTLPTAEHRQILCKSHTLHTLQDV